MKVPRVAASRVKIRAAGRSTGILSFTHSTVFPFVNEKVRDKDIISLEKVLYYIHMFLFSMHLAILWSMDVNFYN